MTNKTKTISTKDIDLAAYVTFVSSAMPETFRDPFDGRAIFEFENRPEIEMAMHAFLKDPARRLLDARRRLFHEVRRITAEAAGGRDGCKDSR